MAYAFIDFTRSYSKQSQFQFSGNVLCRICTNGGSRGGVPGSLLFWIKKKTKSQKEEKPVGQAKKK